MTGPCRATGRDIGVASLVQAQSYTFVEINHDIFSTVILLSLIQEGLLSVTMKVHKVLVNRLVKLAQEKVCLGELTVST